MVTIVKYLSQLDENAKLHAHMGPEPQNSFEEFKEVASAPEYGKGTTGHHTFRDHVSSNQSHPVSDLFT